MFEDESFTIEAMLLQDRDCIPDFFALVGLKSDRTNQERSVQNYQDD